MLTLFQAWNSHRLSNRTVRLFLLSVLLLWSISLWLHQSPSWASALGLGGYISERVIATSAGTSSNLIISPNTSGPPVIGTLPTASTQPATNTVYSGAGTTATLNGNLTNLNGMPRAEVWFEWGYVPGALSNSTTHTFVAATGAYSATLTGYNQAQTVYYRAVASTDGTYYGSTVSFRFTGRGVAWNLLWFTVPLLSAIGIIIVSIRAIGLPNWYSLIAYMAEGLVVFYIIRQLLLSMW